MLTSFNFMEGSAGLREDEIAHVFLPGRGRNEAGDGLTASGLARVATATEFYIARRLEDDGGVLVPSGYKTPAESSSFLWRPENEPSQVFEGIPEGELYRQHLLRRGIKARAIRPEIFSCDSVTNVVYAEHGRRGEGSYFPDDRPVVIVAQEEHLDRFLNIIAPKVLRREFIGLVVPEGTQKETDSRTARAFSRIALRGITPESENIVQTTTQRVENMWAAINLARKSFSAVKNLL